MATSNESRLSRGELGAGSGAAPATWWAIVAAVVLLVAAVSLRLVRLGSLPGVNGDEAWMGVQALRLLAGDEVTWRTPTGNPLNPFSFGPLVVSHALFAPSFAHLRWVAATSGLLLLAVNLALCRVVYGLRTAVVTTVALAVLPDTIAYSRFGWDSSQSVLFTLPVLYLPLVAWRMRQRREWLLVLAAVSWAASVLVHPTNVLAAPLLIIPAITLYCDTLLARYLSLSFWLRALAGVVASLAGVVIAIVGWPWWRAALRRAVSSEQAGEFLQLFVELFSGVTIYRYISGTLIAERELAWGVSDLATVQSLSTLVIVAIVWGLFRTLTSARDRIDRVLLASVLTAVVGFYLIAGPSALRPHMERYGQCLIAGGVLLAGRGVDWYLRQPRLRGPATASLLLLAGLSLIGFVVFYWLPLAQGSARPHPAFRTGPVEPKQAALVLALDELGPGPATIGAGSWWGYWPLAYLAFQHSDVAVVTDGDFGVASDVHPADCWVELVDTPSYERRANQFLRKVPILDPAGREILSVFFSAGAARHDREDLSGSLRFRLRTSDATSYTPRSAR